MSIRDLIAFSLLPASRRRTAALLTLLAPSGDDPGPDVLERLIELSERDAVDAAARAAGLRREADGHLDAAAREGIEPIGLLDARYPPHLRTIPDPPAVLYTRGEPASLSTSSIAIVGSRAASPYGLSVAARLGRDLAAAGLTVVSGLARGCDAAAHQGALDAGGLTVGVVGCGADIVYPAEHRNLYRAVAERGAVVSELPPGAPPLPGHFPRRNRIISGLAGGVVVIEASARSGSLITAACALEQGRDVMAVPGNVLSQRHAGCHDLLRDGARLVQSAQDVLDELGWSSPAPPKAPPDGQQNPATEPLLGCLPPGEDCDLETLAQRSGLPVAVLLGRMTRLELTGAVRRTPGGRFVRAVP